MEDRAKKVWVVGGEQRTSSRLAGVKGPDIDDDSHEALKECARWDGYAAYPNPPHDICV